MFFKLNNFSIFKEILHIFSNSNKDISWRSYKKSLDKYGGYYCHKCIMELYGRDKISKMKLKNSKSFETWCIDNNRQDVLDRWDYELNYLNPYDVPSKSSKKYWFKCNINIHNSELNGIADLTSGKQININCKQCNSFAQWGIDNIGEDFLEKYWDYDKNININPWGINYGNNTKNKRVWIKCQEKDYHGSYKTSCNEFTSNGRCPLCTNQHGKVHPLDSLGSLYPQVLDLWSDKNNKTPYGYAPQSSQQVYWKCKDAKHDDYLREIRNMGILWLIVICYDYEKREAKLNKELDQLLQEHNVEELIRPEGLKAGVEIKEIRFADPAIPPELLVARQREQLAQQL